jgi:hypothetical protein
VPCFNDVDGHRGDGGNQAGHHGRAEVQRHPIRNIPQEHLARLYRHTIYKARKMFHYHTKNNYYITLYCTYKTQHTCTVSQLMAMVGLSLKEISSSQPMDK